VTDNQKILNHVATLEAMANAIILECQQTRKLVEEDVSTPPERGLSEIAIKARMDLRARLLKPNKRA
jgi:hypothetical protein